MAPWANNIHFHVCRLGNMSPGPPKWAPKWVQNGSFRGPRSMIWTGLGSKIDPKIDPSEHLRPVTQEMHGTEINVVGPRGRSNSIYVPCISAKSHPATQIQTPEMGSPNGHPGGQISVSESQISDLGGQISDLGVQIWTSGPQILRSRTPDPPPATRFGPLPGPQIRLLSAKTQAARRWIGPFGPSLYIPSRARVSRLALDFIG